jgi:hypothetical protein
MRDNFLAFLRDETGRIVPGSERCGHNVITNYGRLWLSRLIAWKLIGSTDGPWTDSRLRWMLVGDGSLPETTSVVTLSNSLQADVAGLYLRELENPPDFPISTGVKLTAVYGLNDLSMSGPVLVSEAGLVAGAFPVNSGSSASINESGGVVTVTGLTGMSPLSVGTRLQVASGDNPGPWRITQYIDETSVRIDSSHTGADSGNPSITWQDDGDVYDDHHPVVAYKTFEGIVKAAGFSLEIHWDLRF